MVKLHCCTLLLVSLIGVSLCTNSGAKMRATQSVLDYIKNVGTDILREMLRNQPLPNIIGSTRMFGAVDYAITGVIVDAFHFQKASAIPVVGSDVDVSLNDASATAHGNWRIKHWLLRDQNGGFTLSISGVNIIAKITAFKDESDRPAAILSKCHSHISGADIKFSGSLSWLYNLFSTYMEKPICNNLSTKLCPIIAEALKLLQAVLASFVVKSQIDAYAEVDYFLLNPPVSTTNHIDLDLKGTVHPIGNYQEFDFPLRNISIQEEAGPMLLIGFSEYFFNTVGLTYYTTDVLQQIITDKEFPNTPWLKTSDYDDRIPEMRTQYPISQPVMIKVSANKVPVVTITPGTLQLELFGVFEAIAVLPNATIKPIFSLNLEANLITKKLSVSDFNLIGSFQLNSYKIFSRSSNVGFFRDDALEMPVQFILSSVVLPTLNEGLRKGIPTPSLANITFTNPEVRIDQSSVLISTDLVYIPWSTSLKNQSPMELIDE